MTEQSYQDDEIDLFDLFDDIKTHWRWVLGTFLMALLAGVVYAFLVTPIFKAKIELTAVPEQALTAINLAKARLSEASDVGEYQSLRLQNQQAEALKQANKVFSPLLPSDLFDSFVQQLNSPLEKIAFYQYLMKQKQAQTLALIYNAKLSEEENKDNFLERFSDKFESIKNTQRVTFELSFVAKSADLSAILLNQYLEFIRQKHLSDYRTAFEYELNSSLSAVKGLQKTAQASYEFAKNKRIALLKEAISVAVRIGQKKPFYNLNQVVTGSEPPLYMMGELALSEELKQLQARSQNNQDEALYVEGFALLKESQSLLESIDVNWKDVHLVQVNAYASTPKSAYKPKRKLIVAVSGIAGLMLGVMLALLIAASSRRAQAKREAK